MVDVDGSRRRMFAMVKVREKEAPYQLLVTAKVPDVAAATRLVSVTDLQVRRGTQQTRTAHTSFAFFRGCLVGVALLRENEGAWVGPDCATWCC